MNLYEIFFQTEDWLLQLPVNPSEVTTSGSGGHKKYDMLSIGEAVGIGKPKLQSWRIKSYFPADGDYPSSYYAAKLAELAQQKNPFRLVINRLTVTGSPVYETNTLVLLDKWEMTDNAGEEGDVYYDLTLTEYKPFVAKTL